MHEMQKDRNCRNFQRKGNKVLSLIHIHDIIDKLDDQTLDGLQKIFYYLASVELAWRGGEDATCLTEYFKFETSEDGKETGRLEYNPIVTQHSAVACSYHRKRHK
ncbi:unnamed protein product [Psylliodes chrysocephalus]|uniref:Uncharacterized protein n=1 Tax=Psylliodes chrysocephalus TaxID=3402493 RepID=A0A9P0G3K8_9CUCU|nr:unnamed protein product [Psylliodes chrysocephala]